MRLIASGRASEIFDLGDGRILRRFRAGGDPEREALVMRHAARHGDPVPRVLQVLGDALVLERIDGPTMAADLRRRPWALRAHAALLAQLHQQLHAIAAPPIPHARHAGGRLLHLDLHPANVIAFLPHFDRDDLRRVLPAAVERRLGDPNVTDRERQAVHRLSRQVGVR